MNIKIAKSQLNDIEINRLSCQKGRFMKEVQNTLWM